VHDAENAGYRRSVDAPSRRASGGISVVALTGLDDDFRRGEFSRLKSWLNERIHRPGRRFRANAGRCMPGGEYAAMARQQRTRIMILPGGAPRNSFCFAPKFNSPNRMDATGAFLPYMEAFQRLYGGGHGRVAAVR